MLDEKMILESKGRIERGLKDEKLLKEKEGEFVTFFLRQIPRKFDKTVYLTLVFVYSYEES